MKAVVMTAEGGPEVLEVAELEDPVVSRPDDVLVRLHAAGVNPVDTKMRQGGYGLESLPFVPGWDGAGVVEAVGSSVTGLRPGEEVYVFHGSFGRAPGTYAQYVLASERSVTAKPRSLDFRQAAAVPLVLLTVWEALFERARLMAGQTVLVHAGAGGVGHIAVQLAASAGARVFATVGSAEKAALVRELGAHDAILYRETDFVQAALDLTDGEGVDVVMDNVGGETLQKSAGATRCYGDLVTLLKAGPDVDLSLARMRNLRLGFEMVLTPLVFSLHDEQVRQRRILERAREMFDAGKLRVIVSHALPLEEAATAHRMIEAGGTTGKIVLDVE